MQLTDDKIRTIAARLSASCFFNALLREWKQWSIIPSSKEIFELTDCKQGIEIPIQGHLHEKSAWLPVAKPSPLGRHQYGWPLLIIQHNGKLQEVEFMELANLLAEQESIVGLCTAEQKQRFLSRLQDSLNVIECSIMQRGQDLYHLFHKPLTFLDGEQALVAGHSFHPTPKSREGFRQNELKKYSPEMAASFKLGWFAVHRDILWSRHSSGFASKDCLQALLASDPSVCAVFEGNYPSDFQLLPMHPWQYQYLLEQEVIQRHLRERKLIALGEQGETWYPTSSLRSIYRPASAYMLKFSLSVRLTNSVRNLLPHEVERGIQVQEVFASPYCKELITRYPKFHVMQEPAYFALLDQDKKILIESIVVCRENPFQTDFTGEVIVLASLTQEDPFGRGNLIVQQISRLAKRHSQTTQAMAKQWFHAYCKVVLEPLIMAQADFGILFGAHQQNIVIEFKNDLPTALYYRDCQGTGYSQQAFSKLQDQIKTLHEENGNILSPSQASTLFIYYLIVNATFNVISAIAARGDIDEESLLDELRGFLLQLRLQKPKEPYCLDTLLESEILWQKGNFLCSIQNLNENTTANPLAIYCELKNPLVHKKIDQSKALENSYV